ncbi:MAG: hypothetical protein BGO26_18025 [Actinobacteria bacterium 69-20]|nr:RDD family protein [Actinomycetota bacterium]OJV24493.1 MAG: hypothetical protein BGO26_18025 [Actinobacteria bacterium 69-20]
MHYASRRILAWLIDWACILGWVAVTAAVGVPLYLAGVITRTGALTLNAIGAVVVVVPVALAAAWFESRSNPATPGKRVLGLVVCAAAGTPRFGQTLTRNALKIGLPWLVGHAAVIAIVNTSAGETPISVWALLVVAYLLPLTWIASLFVGTGRTPYDRASRTIVIDRRSPAEP